MVHYKLIYFPIRGAAEPSRQVLAVAGIKFEDERIPPEEWPNRKAGESLCLKLLSGTPFGHLPVLEVDGKPLAQSCAIVRYLARQFGLAGKMPFEEALVDSLIDQFKDYHNEIHPFLAVLVGVKEGDKEALYKEIAIPARNKFFGILTEWLKKVRIFPVENL